LSRRMRDDYRDPLGPSGVTPETVYLATDRGTVLERVRARRAVIPTILCSVTSWRPALRPLRAADS
jgi:hypothetical protein